MNPSALDRVASIRDGIPGEGLFHEKSWRVAPEPFALEPNLVEALEKLGYRLRRFVRACNLLYRLSVKGSRPRWIAEYLDRGKPRELIEQSRSAALREEIPRVLRPDVILTEEGFTIAELDNVPGGIGLTGWLGGAYADLGFQIVGGPDGMVEGFRSILPGGADILVSEEAATYRPEMNWLADVLSRAGGGNWPVFDAETYVSPANPRPIYRFFELFDIPNIPSAPALLAGAAEGRFEISPPPKPWLEEKLWFALFWLRPLREFWRRELGDRHWTELCKVIPRSWILNPEPIPHHAEIPGLDIHSWDELTHFSQKERDLVLKISGFSELAWGSRGVRLGHDLPHSEWVEAVRHALQSFPSAPYILQRFHKGRLVRQRYLDPASGEISTLTGRVRLCPYYFLTDERTTLGGVLATLCPADKKLLHGMSDAVISPCGVSVDNPAGF